MSEYAVLIPWVKTEYGDALLLEVRSDKVRQPGEICFPGGRIEDGESPSEAAIRETAEELGIIADRIRICSKPVIEVMGDGRVVYSVEAVLDIGVTAPDAGEFALDTGGLSISYDEVADVFLVPRKWLEENPPGFYDLSVTEDRDLPAELAKYLARYGDYRRTGSTDYIEYEGRGIWGLTARIIRRLLATSGRSAVRTYLTGEKVKQ